MSEIKFTVDGYNKGQRLVVISKRATGGHNGDIKISSEDNGAYVNVVIGEHEALAMADHLISAAKYCRVR